ncbi:hypothetical protein [Rhizobium leguminosarum]|jgi:hypothetical protein
MLRDTQRTPKLNFQPGAFKKEIVRIRMIDGLEEGQIDIGPHGNQVSTVDHLQQIARSPIKGCWQKNIDRLNGLIDLFMDMIYAKGRIGMSTESVRGMD